MWELEDKEQMMCAMRVHFSKCIRRGWTWRVVFRDPQRPQANALFGLMSPVFFWTIPFQLSQDWGRCLVSVWGFFSGGVHQRHRSSEDNYQGRSATQWRPRRLRADRVGGVVWLVISIYHAGLFHFYFPYYSIAEPLVHGMTFAERWICFQLAADACRLWLTSHKSVIRFTNR